MSSTNRENSTDPEHNLTAAEVDDLGRLEGVAQQRLGSYLQVAEALAEIRDRRLYRDSHPSFEAYVRERWGLSGAEVDPLSPGTGRADAGVAPVAGREPGAALGHKPCETLAKVCEQTLSTLDGEERVGIEIRFSVRPPGEGDAPAHGLGVEPSGVAGAVGEELLPRLRWLLTQATGTIGEVAHHLEVRAADIDDGARAQLRDDVLVLEGELAVAKALLLESIDWDSELGRLLGDELPPFDTDTDPEDDE